MVMADPTADAAAVLVVEDDPIFTEIVRDCLLELRCNASFATDGLEAMELLGRDVYDLLLLDLRLPGCSGLDVLHRARQLGAPPEVIVMSADQSLSTVIEVMKAGAADYLPKPIDFDYLHLVVGKAIIRRRDGLDLRALRSQVREGGSFHGMIGTSPGMQVVYRRIQEAAMTRRPVLVRGETGTGKELVARAIHAAGPNPDAPFISINCGAIPESLLESELFGHEKGAFTGATRARPGIMEQVGSGTLVLDDVQQMPLAMQGMLLRAVEQMEIRRVGAAAATTVSFRLVSTTNQPLDAMVSQGSFRQDLLFRLSVLPIALPPLRERHEDILALAGHFLAKHSAEGTRLVRGYTPEAQRWMLAQPWPGNVRELEHTVERALVFGSRLMITQAELAGNESLDSGPGLGADVLPTLKQARSEFERGYIEALLAQTSGNLAAAARQAGMNRQYLYVKARKLGIPLRAEDERAANGEDHGQPGVEPT